MPQPAPEGTRIGGVALCGLALVVLQLAFGVVRVPGIVVWRRGADIADHRENGAVRHWLDTEHRRGAAAVEWVLANVPSDAAVLYRGDSKGAIEFVPALIAPRLLVRDEACRSTARTYAGRPLARRVGPDGDRVVVIAARGDALDLEDR
jgi:hypothetical protein